MDVTLIKGDGIGPEIIDSAKRIIDESGAKINWDVKDAGLIAFEKGINTGLPNDTIKSIKQNKVALKGPLATPIGYGHSSINVLLRKIFDTYANIRPVKTIKGIDNPYANYNIDFVLIRENLEDLYIGAEYMQSSNDVKALKLISKLGCEKIIRLAFEMARSQKRKSVHCATKANILKQTEGLLKSTFEDVAKEYNDIESYHVIVDNAAHQMVKTPEQFEVMVMTNMNGDILSDLGSGLVGGLGFAPSCNMGDSVSLFEAVHGSAPKYAGLDVINPSSVIFSGIMMLRHIGFFKEAIMIENAILKTIEDGKVITKDINPNIASKTSEFTKEIIKNFGQKPSNENDRQFRKIKLPIKNSNPPKIKQNLVGIDIYIVYENNQNDLAALVKEMESVKQDFNFDILQIANRGFQLYPKDINIDQIDLTNVFCIRLIKNSSINEDMIAKIIEKFPRKWQSVEKLYSTKSENSFSKLHGSMD